MSRSLVDIRFNKTLSNDGFFNSRLDKAMEASMHIVESAYVEQTPVNTGDFRQGIKIKREGDLQYIVKSTARSKQNKNYPLFLYKGTGKLKGAPDYGFTTGRVRANDVRRGIGGIRPNKAAMRAKKDAEKPYIRKVDQLVGDIIKK